LFFFDESMNIMKMKTRMKKNNNKSASPCPKKALYQPDTEPFSIKKFLSPSGQVIGHALKVYDRVDVLHLHIIRYGEGNRRVIKDGANSYLDQFVAYRPPLKQVRPQSPSDLPF
jgi:hypothetical protein